ncbi:MAG: hypothetical protein C0463_00915 [Idiomarina sp.]|nr:hypothetical protein [Idiomarina sp.]
MFTNFRPHAWLAALACLFLIACSDTGSAGPTLDLSDESAFESSIQGVMASLDEQQQADFSDALAMIMFDELANGTSSGLSEEEIERAIYQRLHGKTGEEVIADMEQNL